jgi:dimethylamine monooxygenase subunit A
VEPGPIPYVPLNPAGFKMAMGLRPLEEKDWLQVDHRWAEQVEKKKRLLESSQDIVVATRPGGDAGSAEVLEMILENLETFHPTINRTIDESEHPLVAASRLIQEDLCLLVKSDTWRLEAASVCFPSRWFLPSKIGRTMDEIHGPVPGYDAQLASPTNALFDRLSVDRSYWRLNWTLIDNDDLYQPQSIRKSPSGDLSDWFFRVERQTLRYIPRAQGILFTIRNYVAPASELALEYESFTDDLLRSIETAPIAMQEYKGWVGVVEKIRAELD